MDCCVVRAGVRTVTALVVQMLRLLLLLCGLVARALGMTFTPSPDEAGHMRSNWDNWGMIHNGTWYMYYIVGGECSGRWVAYAYATSSDGVHWTDHGDMLYASQTGEEQSCANAGYALGSGWVWQNPATGKWLVDFSQTNKLAGPGQSIFFAESDTPVGPWRNISAQKSWDFRPDTKYYEYGGRWDTIRVVPKEAPAEGFWGFITANPLISAVPGPPPPAPPPPPPPKPLTPCKITTDFGCHRELNCGGDVSKRCLGLAMLGGGAGNSREACACACHARNYTLAGIEVGACFCGDGKALDPAKCGAVPASNTSKVCTKGVGGGNCAVSAFAFSCPAAGNCAAPPPPPAPSLPIRSGFALVESSNGYDWSCLPGPVINFKIAPKAPTTEASGVQPITGPDGKKRWYALVGAAAWTSIGGKMGMFAYVAENMTGPYEELPNAAVMAYQQGWTTPAYFLTFYPTEAHGMLLNHQVVAPGGGTIGGDFIAPFKTTHIDDTDGSLRLIYWKGNDVLKGAERKKKNAVAGSFKSSVVGGLNGTLGFVVEGTVEVPAGGALLLCPCTTDDSIVTAAANCSAAGSMVKVDGADLTMELCKGGSCEEHVDRALTPAMLGLQAGSTNFTLLQRHGMWEFYLGGFLALPERMATAPSCMEIVAQGGLTIAHVWDMTEMPPNAPVPTAPTYPKR